MAYKIAEALIENGQIKYINKKLPSGRIKVHVIYDEMDEEIQKLKVEELVYLTAGMYKILIPNLNYKDSEKTGKDMTSGDLLLDTIILIYHIQGYTSAVDLIRTHIPLRYYFYISILTKIEFLGAERYTVEGLKLCKELIDYAIVLPVDKEVADKDIDLKRKCTIKLDDATITVRSIPNLYVKRPRLDGLLMRVKSPGG